MLGLESRDYQSLRFNTDLPKKPSVDVIDTFTFGIKAGFNKAGFPELIRTVSVIIHFTSCRNQTITPIPAEMFFKLDLNSGLQEFLSEDEIIDLFTLSEDAKCPAITNFDILKSDRTEIASTDSEYAYLDLAKRDYSSFKFDTDDTTLLSEGVYKRNFTFVIRAGFKTDGYPEEEKEITVGIVLSLCKEKTINVD